MCCSIIVKKLVRVPCSSFKVHSSPTACGAEVHASSGADVEAAVQAAVLFVGITVVLWCKIGQGVVGDTS